MRIGGAIVLVLLFLVVLAAGLHAWRHQEAVSAQYKPSSALTTEETLFVQKAHDLIKTAANVDEDATAGSRSQSVRDFAAEDATAQKQMLDRLEKTVASINPDFIFQPVETIEPTAPSLDRYVDRDYVEGIIRIEERGQALIEDASGIQHSPQLTEFTAVWLANVKSRLEKARSLLATLPKVPCP